MEESNITVLSNRNMVKIDNSLLDSHRFDLSTLEAKIVFKFISEIKQEDTEFKKYSLTIPQLEKALGGENYRIDRDTIYNFSKNIKPIEIRNGKSFTHYPWFIGSGWNDETKSLEVQVNPLLRNLFLDLNSYFKYDIRNLFELNSKYSQKIYMLLKKEIYKGTHKVNVVEFQDWLKVPSSYRIWDRFRERVMEKSIEDINKHTDLNINYQVTKKQGKKIIELEFNIKIKKEILKERDNFKTWFKREYKYYNEEILIYKGLSLIWTENHFKSITEFYKFEKQEIDEIWELLEHKSEILKDNIQKWKKFKEARS